MVKVLTYNMTKVRSLLTLSRDITLENYTLEDMNVPHAQEEFKTRLDRDDIFLVETHRQTYLSSGCLGVGVGKIGPRRPWLHQCHKGQGQGRGVENV